MKDKTTWSHKLTRMQIIVDVGMIIMCFVLHYANKDLEWWVLPLWIGIALLAHIQELRYENYIRRIGGH